MELIMAPSFLLILGLFAGAALLLTEKIKDLTNWTTKVGGYVLSGVASAILVAATKYVGASETWFILKLLIEKPGETPAVPVENPLGWGFWIILWIGSWLVAGGIYDWRKLR